MICPLVTNPKDYLYLFYFVDSGGTETSRIAACHGRQRTREALVDPGGSQMDTLLLGRGEYADQAGPILACNKQ
jgi:hypothetical protein